MSNDPSDFTRFEATLDPSNDPPPCRLPIIDRKLMLSTYEEYIEEDLRVRANLEIRNRKITIGPVGKHYSRARLQDLQSVTLAPDGGLRTNEIGYGELKKRRVFPNAIDADGLLTIGKVLFCRNVSTSALKLTSLQLMMEDPKGLICLIHLFHLPSNYSEEDLITLFPPGGYFGPLLLT